MIALHLSINAVSVINVCVVNGRKDLEIIELRNSRAGGCKHLFCVVVSELYYCKTEENICHCANDITILYTKSTIFLVFSETFNEIDLVCL